MLETNYPKEQTLVEKALQSGAHKAAVIAAADIPLRREFREACEQNTCGQYGKCWTCPPDVGDIDVLMARVRGYDRALVFQTVGQLDDSFDYEGMQRAAQAHDEVTGVVFAAVMPDLPGALGLGAGSCQACDPCAKVQGEPCPYPERAVPSLEAHGVAVSELAPVCGMNYINGQNTVTYFGAVLFGHGE